MLPAISEVLAEREALMQRAETYLQPQKRLVRIGTSPLISSAILQAIVEPFQDQNPEVDLILREMNLDDLYRMLEDGAIDFVFGAVGVSTSNRARKMRSSVLYREPLLFIPRQSGRDGPTRKNSVSFGDIAGETFVMVPDTCGLAQATRTLFRSHRRKIREYSGQALSYQVLEQWANLGIGSAVLPKSKVSPEADLAIPIIDKAGRPATIEFEAVWTDPDSTTTHLVAFAQHLRNVVPALIEGLV